MKLTKVFLTCLVCVASVLISQPAQAQTQPDHVLEKMGNATVMVILKVQDQNGVFQTYAFGSGYFLNRTGLCMTNNHVVDGVGHMAGRWQNLAEGWKWKRFGWFIVVNGGTPDENVYRGDVLYRNDMADMALVQVYEDWDTRTYLETEDFLRLRDTRTVDIATKVWDWGFPGGKSRDQDKNSNNKDDEEAVGEHPLVIHAEGPVVGFTHQQNGDFKMISLDLMCDPGNSGGPVVDINGDLVGTATHKPPSSVPGRPHQTDLVPADVSRKFIQTAFQRERLGADIDLEPFYALLEGVDGYMHVPTFPRDEQNDCLYWENGQQICGEITAESLTFTTSLGELTIPTTSLAYLLPDEDGIGAILLDGGQRIPLLYEDLTIELTLDNGETYEPSFSDLLAVAFKKKHELPSQPEGMGLLLDGPEYNLYLSNAEGEAEFESKDGIVFKKKLSDIRSIQKNEDDEQIVTFNDGSILAGQFSDDTKIKATFMVSGETHEISLEPAYGLKIAEVDFGVRQQFSRRISDIFRTLLAQDLLDIAQDIDSGNIDAARRKIKQFSGHDYIKSINKARRNQVNLLRGVIKWRTGEYDEAIDLLKSIKYAKDDQIANYARSILTVAKEYPDFKYDGKQLSDPKVFQKAANIIATNYLHDALAIIQERDKLNLGDLMVDKLLATRSQFFNLRNKIRTSKDKLEIAGQLKHPMAAWATVQLLTIERELYMAEMMRLEESLENPRQQNNQGRKSRGKDRQPTEREMEKAREAYEQTKNWFEQIGFEIGKFQFMNSDPFIQIPE